MTSKGPQHAPNVCGVVSVSQMAKMLQLSRSRLYQLVAEGVLLPPSRDPRTGRPFYDPDTQRENLAIKRRNVGANGQVVLFYRPRRRSQARRASSSAQNPSRDQKKHAGLLRELRGALRHLGLKGLSNKEIEEALRACYPKGPDGKDEGEFIKDICRFLRQRRPRT